MRVIHRFLKLWLRLRRKSIIVNKIKSVIIKMKLKFHYCVRVRVYTPWSRRRVEECVLAGRGLDMSGWADREHSRCRCPSPYHSARLTHTHTQIIFTICVLSKTWMSYLQDIVRVPSVMHLCGAEYLLTSYKLATVYISVSFSIHHIFFSWCFCL